MGSITVQPLRTALFGTESRDLWTPDRYEFPLVLIIYNLFPWPCKMLQADRPYRDIFQCHRRAFLGQHLQHLEEGQKMSLTHRLELEQCSIFESIFEFLVVL